ncbi:MAG: hypothetical protein GQF41_2053 [Candidatus Rifleibacterium amylolyticum]|nr:MAG: hypothetical protein GQF41_2053 [Candidatus Rifleibacterium amylolyticum]NLF98303.1 DUF4258 domain-containing protein [Candidatus Riflebacteria bacterium]
MGRRRIARFVKTGEYQMTRHAYDQMMARDIFIRQVEDAILNGRVARRWSERDGEKLAIIGERFNGDFIKVVVKDTEIPKVITVCYPYEELD